MSASSPVVTMVDPDAPGSFTPPWDVVDPRGWSGGKDPYAAAAAIGAELGAPLGVRRMLRYQLASESRGQAAASLGIRAGAPAWVNVSKASDKAKRAESAAALIAWSRVDGDRRAVWAAAGWKSASWTFGSGGLYGLLPANGLITVIRSEPDVEWVKEHRASPWDVFDPRRGTALYLDFLRRTSRFTGVRRWVDFKAAAASLVTLRDKEQSPRYRAILENVPGMMERAGLPDGWALGDVDDASRAWLRSFDLIGEVYGNG